MPTAYLCNTCNSTICECKAAKRVSTMLVGHVVDAMLIGEADSDGNQRAVFLCHHDSGAQTLCLDFGQGWTVGSGYVFKTNAGSIATAAKHIAGLYRL